ncbi:MAG: hypothetical protein AB1442_01805 [Nitrospirota bacterium]
MNKPYIRYLVASPAGDIPVDNDKLDFPLEADPLKTPYRDYFRSIDDFLLCGDCSSLLWALNDHAEKNADIDEIKEIVVRTEKHGALYHPASVEVVLGDRNPKFALNVAVTDTGKDSLKREFTLLQALREKFSLPYIPKPYCMVEANSAVFLLEEWFEGYHEFHIADAGDGMQRLKLWEYGKGDRFLSARESFEVYRQASRILTLYYDWENFRVVYPWHHAAGDFVAGIKGQNIDVRLTTVRGYEPFMGFDKEETVNPVLALFYFFLHLSVQMRLDKLDGVGDIVWAEDLCVDATLEGFFQGLEGKKDFEAAFGSPAAFLKLMRSFGKGDLRKTFAPIIEQFNPMKDLPVVERNLEAHISGLYATLQTFH